jgi:hypothetical protein
MGRHGEFHNLESALVGYYVPDADPFHNRRDPGMKARIFDMNHAIEVVKDVSCTDSLDLAVITSKSTFVKAMEKTCDISLSASYKVFIPEVPGVKSAAIGYSLSNHFKTTQ